MPFNAQTLGDATTGVFAGATFTDSFLVGGNEAKMIRLTLTAGRFYEIDVDNGTAGDFYLRIFDARGHEVRANDDGNFLNDDVVFSLSPYTRFVPAYTGEYYVAISPYYLSTYDPATTAGRVSGENPLVDTAGTLTVSDIAPAPWGSSGSINAITLESGSDLTDMLRTAGGRTRLEVNGSIDTLPDLDMIRVDLVKGSRVVIDVNGALPGSTVGTVLRVFDDTGVQIGNDDDSGFGEDPELVFQAPIFDDYYIGITAEGNSTYNGLDGTGTVNGAATGAFNVIVHVNPTHVGSGAANILNGTAGDDYIVSLSGNDTVNAGGGRDMVAGGDDNDSLSGGDGDDDIYGEHGNDSLFGGNGADVLLGGIGNDALDGGNGDDTLFGGAGSDRLYSGLGDDEVYGEADNDVLYSSAGTDLFDGGAGNDIIYFTAEAIGATINLNNSALNAGSALGDTLVSVERISGTNAADILIGDSAANTFVGNGGADRLDGGLGADILAGGANSDTFVFTIGQSGTTAATLDSISDYAKGLVGTGDEIDASVPLTIGGNATAATATQASINATTGVASFFAGSGTTMADALLDISARMTAATNAAGEFALFRVNNTGNFHLFISDGVAGVGANDVLVQMTGITSIGSINLTAGDLTILT